MGVLTTMSVLFGIINLWQNLVVFYISETKQSEIYAEKCNYELNLRQNRVIVEKYTINSCKER